MRQQSKIGQFGQDAQTTEERLLRVAANGQFLDEPPQPAPNAPGWRSDSTGRYVGYEIDEHQAKRSTATGRIKSLSPAGPVTKQEQTSRWGSPDTGGNISDRRLDEQDAMFRAEPMSQDEEFSARASSADVSLSPDEGLRGVGATGMSTPTDGDVPVTDEFGRFDKSPQDEDRELRELSAAQQPTSDAFDTTAGGSSEALYLFGGGSDSGRFGDSSPEDPINTEPGTAGRAVEEFNAGGMGLGELGAELEARR